MTFSYSLPTTDQAETPSALDMLRFLINDVDADSVVFQDEELYGVLALEGGAVKLAAAQVIDTNADNEALASKVLRTQDLTTDGAKLAQVLHARAEQLRTQHFNDLEDDGYFDIIDAGPYCGAELAPRGWL